MEKITAMDAMGISWTYETEEERDGDGFYYDEHYAVSPDGKRRHLDWSRFGHYNREHFERFVAAGMPRRKGLGPYRPEDIVEMEPA